MSEISSSDGKKSLEQPDETSTDPKSLSDMPVDVVQPIIEKLDYRQQLKLRKVSKSFRALVDKQKPPCKSVQIECRIKKVNISFNGQHVMYTKQLHGYEEEEDCGIIVLKDDFMKVAFDDLASTLKNPKLQLEEFRISSNLFKNEDREKYHHKIQCVLESLNRQVSVKKINIQVLNPSCLLSILPYLKPGFLEKISLSFDYSAVDWKSDSIGMDQIAYLDQWKQAEELELQYCFDRFPMEYTTHFKRFRICEPFFREDKLIRINDFLSKLDNFEKCTLTCWDFHDDPISVYELLGGPVFRSTTEVVFHHPIPNSDYYFEVKTATFSENIEIEKKKREDN